jgi:hypothetical protein
MSYCVYGIRLKGETNVRYIGHTKGTPEARLDWHLKQTIHEPSFRPLLPWARANRDQIEAFKIADCESEKAARVTESVVIALCLRLNQPLLNVAQVPPHLWPSRDALSVTRAGDPLPAGRSGGRCPTDARRSVC